jgi:hypothetical protein
VSEGLQSVAHKILEPTGFQPVVVQLLQRKVAGVITENGIAGHDKAAVLVNEGVEITLAEVFLERLAQLLANVRRIVIPEDDVSGDLFGCLDRRAGSGCIGASTGSMVSPATITKSQASPGAT